MKKLRHCLIPLVLASAFSAAAFADEKVFDDRFYFAPMGSYALAPSGQYLDNGYGGRLAVGKSVVPHLGFELLGSYLNYPGQEHSVPHTGLCNVPLIKGLCPDDVVKNSVGVANVGAGVNVFLSPSNHWLYAHVDAMGGNKFVYEGGLGLIVPLTKHGFGLRAEALYHKANPDQGRPLFNLGLFIPIGEVPAPPVAPPPEPVAVVPVQEPPPAVPPPCETPAPGERINLEGCKTGDTLVLRGVNFDFNKATLTADAKAILDQVAESLTTRGDLKVELDGHTDSIGSDSYNQKLSERRADSVKAYLVGKGLDGARLTTRGFGETMPIADNKTQEGRDLNRRVELKVIDSGGSVDVPVSSGATESSTVPPATVPADSAPAADAAPPAADSAPPPADAPVPAGDAAAPAADAH